MLTLTEIAKARIEAFADAAIKQIQDNIRNKPVYNGKPANASGKTANSLSKEWQGDTLVISGIGHIFALEFGRKPTSGGGSGGETLRERIRTWIDDKGIGAAMNDKQKNSLSWAISTNIHRKGTLLYQSGKQSGSLSEAVNEEKIINLSKELLDLFAVEATSLLLKQAA